jgi:pimeloyl-ACP methyl ester carboxylesterase
MPDPSQPSGGNNPLSEWLTFRRGQALNLRRSYTMRVPTLGGPTLWGDIQLFNGFRIQRHHLTQHCRILDRKDRRVFWGSEAECLVELEGHPEADNLAAAGRHLVLCLHGMFRSKNAMSRMRDALEEAGFNAWALNYPSTVRTIEEHAEQIASLLDKVEGIDRVSFVCHSMGGLIARAVLAKGGDWRARIQAHRLIMIATPNQGAFLARKLTEKTWLFRMLAGPAGAELSPDWVRKLPPPDIEFGIIAGGRDNGRGFNPFLRGDDDMTVTVASTKLDGATDFLLVHAIHTFIVQNPKVIQACVRFLQHGQFLDTP